MITAKDIRTWCLARPRAAKVRVTQHDGTVVEVAAPTPPASWAMVAETIAAIEPRLMEALDDKGTLLRAKRDDEEVEVQDDPQHKFKVPANITDPETQRFTHMSNLLANAYRFSTEVAFNKLAEMFESLQQGQAATARRLELVEAQARRARDDLIEVEIDAAHAAGIAAAGGEGKQPSLMEQMFVSFIQGKTQGENDAKGNGAAKPNGKGTKPS